MIMFVYRQLIINQRLYLELCICSTHVTSEVAGALGMGALKYKMFKMSVCISSGRDVWTSSASQIVTIVVNKNWRMFVLMRLYAIFYCIKGALFWGWSLDIKLHVFKLNHRAAHIFYGLWILIGVLQLFLKLLMDSLPQSFQDTIKFYFFFLPLLSNAVTFHKKKLKRVKFLGRLLQCS